MWCRPKVGFGEAIQKWGCSRVRLNLSLSIHFSLTLSAIVKEHLGIKPPYLSRVDT